MSSVREGSTASESQQQGPQKKPKTRAETLLTQICAFGRKRVDGIFAGYFKLQLSIRSGGSGGGGGGGGGRSSRDGGSGGGGGGSFLRRGGSSKRDSENPQSVREGSKRLKGGSPFSSLRPPHARVTTACLWHACRAVTVGILLICIGIVMAILGESTGRIAAVLMLHTFQNLGCCGTLDAECSFMLHMLVCMYSGHKRITVILRGLYWTVVLYDQAVIKTWRLRRPYSTVLW